MNAFTKGWVKAAAQVGFNESAALMLRKMAEEPKRKPYKLPHGESSFMGRYMASNAMDSAAAYNHEAMLNKMDPDGTRFSKGWFLHQPELTEQRGHAAKMVPSTLARDAGRSIGSDMGIMGLLGGGMGALAGVRHNRGEDQTLLGAGIGAGVGAGIGGLANLWAKYRKSKITQEDVDKTLDRKKNNSLLKTLTPFSSMYDAATPNK